MIQRQRLLLVPALLLGLIITVLILLTQYYTPQPPPTPVKIPTSDPHSTEPKLIKQEQPGGNGQPTLSDFWTGQAEFILEIEDTGLPMGESDTVVMSDGQFWSYLHASQPSAGTVDQCGTPVEFPGCTVIYRSTDGGQNFKPDSPPICQFECKQCPCDSEIDHIDQQQYPRVYYNDQILTLAYEYRGRTMLRYSADGLNWSLPDEITYSGIWELWYKECTPEEKIGKHPYAPYQYECLAGGPPGVYIAEDITYIFMAQGQNPGSMGCYFGLTGTPAALLKKCANNPLFTGAEQYGELEKKGATTNPFFDFRIISSADVQKVGDRYYMLYEGVRGAGAGDAGDSQFGLGLARSLTNQIDGAWEKFPGNPILVDLPGNIGLGHADLVIFKGQTLLYTSLDGNTRSRLALKWNERISESANQFTINN